MSDRSRWHIKDPTTQARVLAKLRRFAGNHLRWRGKHPIPENCQPKVRELFEEINRQRAALHEVASRVGTTYDVVSGWRRRDPSLSMFEAAVNALGGRIKIVWDGGAE